MKHAKRFYKKAALNAQDDGFCVELDGRPLKTPGKQLLFVRSENIAELIAAEWEAQIETIKPETMPITRLVNVAIELTPNNRDKLAQEARNYAETDLLCYRAENPLELAERQAAAWDPVLKWARERDIDLETTQTVLAIPQSNASLDAVATYALTLADIELTLFVHLTAVFGSAILSLAVMQGFLSGSQAFELSRLDNLYQIEQWGEDEDAAEIAANLAQEVAALCQIVTD